MTELTRKIKSLKTIIDYRTTNNKIQTFKINNANKIADHESVYTVINDLDKYTEVGKRNKEVEVLKKIKNWLVT